ncbi:hypothetical protein EfmAA242_04470 [Enterococcus faecium]|nr:hypothetical protein EfmAA242_04470 [Enterococcus faecium]
MDALSNQGIIKRTQSAVFGGLYAYSGANTMYRKEALIDVGGFRQDRAIKITGGSTNERF